MSVNLNLIQEIASKSVGDISSVNTINEVFIDSRKQVQNGLFIPIIGERFDGHDFLLAAINNGATTTLWKVGKPLPEELSEDFPVFYVDDTLKALEQLAKVYLIEVAPKVIGVTGSNGKTTTKDLLEAVLSSSFKTHKTAGNYNNHIGLPLTILAMPSNCEVLILEMGMSNYGEISFLSKLAEPDIAIITNIGESHIEQLGSREGIAKAKKEIADGLVDDGLLVVDGDEPLLSISENYNMIKCGYNAPNDVQIVSLQQRANEALFTLNNGSEYKINLLGKHNVKNSLYAIVVGKYLGLSEHTIQLGLDSCKLTGMRMEKKQGINGSTIINDAYNASPTSMKAAIDTIKQLEQYQRRILVLGDMYELGKNEESLHRSVADSISAPITHVITVGEKGAWIARSLLEKNIDNIEVRSYKNKNGLKNELEKLLDDKSIVLIKASRGMKLETIATELYEERRD